MKASAKVSATRASAVRDVTRDGESSDVRIPSLAFSATQRVPSRRCGHAGDGDVDDARRVDARADAVEPGVARNDCLTPKPKLNGKCTLRECCNFVMDVDDIRCYGTKPPSRVHPRGRRSHRLAAFRLTRRAAAPAAGRAADRERPLLAPRRVVVPGPPDRPPWPDALTVTAIPGVPSFTGSTGNGVATGNFGSVPAAIQFS